MKIPNTASSSRTASKKGSKRKAKKYAHPDAVGQRQQQQLARKLLMISLISSLWIQFQDYLFMRQCVRRRESCAAVFSTPGRTVCNYELEDRKTAPAIAQEMKRSEETSPSVLARPRVGRWSFVEDYCRKFLLFFFHCAEVTFFFASAQEENAPWVPFSSEPCSVWGFTSIPVRQLLVAILLRAFGLWDEMVKWFEMFVGEHFSNHLLGRVGTSCFIRF